MPNGSSTVVLLVEDNPGDAFVIRRMLKGDLEVIHVSRLSEALQYFQKYSIDVILLDLNLPDSAGLETLTRIRAHSMTVPIIVTTGMAERDIAVMALNAGAQDFIAKEKMVDHHLNLAICRLTNRYGMKSGG